MNLRRTTGLLILFVVLLDQAVKFYVKLNFSYGEEVSIFGSDHFLLHFVENDGMAFGFSLGGWYGKLFLSVFRLVAVVLIGVYLRELIRDVNSRRGVIIGFALVLSGAIGNIIDSALYGLLFSASPSFGGQTATFLPEGGGYAPLFFGRVVDMFYFPVWYGEYPAWLPFVGGEDFLFFRPVFNVADVAISLGVCLLLGWMLRFLRPVSEQ
ncbi:lipoprotein signal peptidase [Lewinellaceae bacterium SD302]|nr:lipoprotein signal peptidase [Lewinellaceae bacterium SD302]